MNIILEGEAFDAGWKWQCWETIPIVWLNPNLISTTIDANWFFGIFMTTFVAYRRLKNAGILCTSLEANQIVGSVDTLILDKSGTITEENVQLTGTHEKRNSNKT